MKIVSQFKTLSAAAFLAAMLVSPAQAVPITGDFNIASSGGTQVRPTSVDGTSWNSIWATMPASWTQINFTGASQGTLTFQNLGGVTLLDPVSLQDINLTGTGQQLILGTTADSRNLTFTVNSFGTKTFAGNNATIDLIGEMSLSGTTPTYDNTPWTVSFTCTGCKQLNNNGGVNSWDMYAFASPVPAPASLFLLGAGMLGLSGVARRNAKVKA